MIKLLLPIAAIILVIGFSIWKLSPYFSQKNPEPKTSQTSEINVQTPKPGPIDSPFPSISPETTPDPQLLKRAEDLDSALSQISDLENRVKNLESTITGLTTSVYKLEQKSSPSPSPSAAAPTVKTPIFIPVNSAGGSVNSTSWTSLTSGSITLNPSDFPGYTSMNLIITLNVYQGNGKAYARLANSSNGDGISTSELSTTSENATQVTSGAFTLPSGQASYTIQLKTLTTGYPSIAGSSFIKVNF